MIYNDWRNPDATAPQTMWGGGNWDNRNWYTNAWVRQAADTIHALQNVMHYSVSQANGAIQNERILLEDDGQRTSHLDEISPDDVADAYQSLSSWYASLNPECADVLKNVFFQNLLESQQYHQLHQSCKGNPAIAQDACLDVYQAYQQFLAVNPKAPEEDWEILAADTRAARMADNIPEATLEKAKDLAAATSVIGFGVGSGSSEEELAGVVDIVQKLAGDSNLLAITKQIGRMTEFGMATRQAKVGEPVGREIGRNLSRMVHTERGKYVVSRIDWLRRYCESALAIKELDGEDDDGLGPMVILVDESGSMSGQRIVHAKGIAGAMVNICRHDNRKYSVGSFCRNLTSFIDDPTMLEYAKWLLQFSNGGTAFDWLGDNKILKRMSRGSDLVVITDGSGGMSNSTQGILERHRKTHRWTLHVIEICPVGSMSPLRRVADNFHESPLCDTDDVAVRDMLTL